MDQNIKTPYIDNNSDFKSITNKNINYSKKKTFIANVFFYILTYAHIQNANYPCIITKYFIFVQKNTIYYMQIFHYISFLMSCKIVCQLLKTNIIKIFKKLTI